MIPANRAQFREYCLRKLGKNVIEINVDPDQVEDRIDEALDFWRTFHMDATVRTYMKYPITQIDIDNGYIPVNDDVFGVTRIFRFNSVTSGSGQVNMFDWRYQMYLNDYVSFRMPEMLDYYMIRTHLEQIDQFFTGDMGLTFNRHTGKITIHTDWSKFTPGEYLIIETLVALDGEEFASIWSDRMLQRYCTALIKQQWGNNMKKHTNIRMLSGLTLDGQTIYNEATEELEKLEDDIREAYEVPPMPSIC